MKGSIESLNLEREVILVTSDAHKFFTRTGNCNHRAILKIGLKNCAANFKSPEIVSVGGQVARDKAALAASHVAIGTSSFAKENDLALFGIPRQSRVCPPALQHAQIAHYSCDARLAQRAECRHSSSGDALLDSADQGSIGQALHFPSLRDVGSTLAAAAVQSMTCGAAGGKEFPTLRQIYL